jgi:hypothetical protein
MAEKFICKACGYVGKQKTETPGQFWVELVLWIMLIVPGLIYSVWRISARRKVCPKCKARDMIPVDTPVGQEMVKKLAGS